MNVKDKIKSLAREIQADKVKKTKYKWKGYDVYNPIYTFPVCIGPPNFILVNGEDVRLTEPEEAFAIIDKYYSKNIG